MKKIFNILLIFLIIWINFNYSYSFSETNSSQTINFLIKYTNSKIYDINKIVKKYHLENDNIIKEKIKELKNINNFLQKNTNNPKNKDYIDKLIKKLKNNNNYLKQYIKKLLENKKLEAKKYSIVYFKRIKPIINKLNDIVINIAKKLMQKEKLNYKDKQIIQLLYQIKIKLDSLEKITKINFNTKEDLQQYIINKFNQIKTQFNSIKNIVQNK